MIMKEKELQILSVRVSRFCCGLFEIGTFPQRSLHSSEEGYQRSLNRSFRELEIIMTPGFFQKASIEKRPIGGFLVTTIKNVFPSLFVTLVERQQSDVEPTLLEHGFIKGHSWKNPNTGNTVTLYTHPGETVEERK